jgi:hypothetical protein
MKIRIGRNVGNAEGKGLCSAPLRLDSGRIIYIQNFIQIMTGIPRILRISLGNLKGCNVGIIVGKDL